MKPIKEELNLGDQKKAFKGKTIKIKKLVKKETGSFTLRDTYINAEDTINQSGVQDGHDAQDDAGYKVGQGGNMLPSFASQVHEDEATHYNFTKQGNHEPNEVRMSHQSTVSQTLTQYERNQIGQHNFAGPQRALKLPGQSVYGDTEGQHGQGDNISPTRPEHIGQFSRPEDYRHGGQQHGDPRDYSDSQARDSRAMYSNEEHSGSHQMTQDASNMASPRMSETSTGGGMLQPHKFVVPGVPAPPPKMHQTEDTTASDARNSTTEFIGDRDPKKQVTKITILSNGRKPVTEFVNRKSRLENNMFLSGYINKPATGAGRFGDAGQPATRTDQHFSVPSGDNALRPSVMHQSINMSDSSYMSTSMYMGHIVTNRFANAANVPAASNKARTNNVMYHSQALNAGVGAALGAQAFKKDMKLFTIPPKVQQYMDNAGNELKYLEKDVVAEKEKMNLELDAIQQTVLSLIQQKRTELNNLYDGYLDTFKANVDATRHKMSSFKDTTDWVKMQNSENGDRLVRLTDIAYYSKDVQAGVYKAYKKDAHKNICELRNLGQEVQKHNLEFYVAELERMGIHYPTFANTASSAEFLGEVKGKLIEGVQAGMEDYAKLAYSAPYVRFNEVFSEPHIFTSLGESRINCLTNIRDISGGPLVSCNARDLSHEEPVTSILNIDDDSFATGDAAGAVHVYNLTHSKETHKFKMKGITRVTSLARIRTTYDLVAGGQQMIASQVIDDKEKHDRNVFLVSGHAKPDCFISIWDLKKQVFVKQLKGHTDDITAISSLQDGHTLLTGSKSGATLIYNITGKKPIKSFQSLMNASVNCIYTFNDLARFAIGYNNGEVSICSLTYEIGMHDKIAVCVGAEARSMLKAKSPVLCVNESHTNLNTAITGHADHKIRIWDLASGQAVKELTHNHSPVMATLVIENPFSIDLQENYHVVSCGQTDDDIYITQPKHDKHCKLEVKIKLDFSQEHTANPRLQLYRHDTDGVNFAGFSNTDGKAQIVLVTVK